MVAFAGTMATRMVIAPARDPEFKGMTERNNGYFETSFLPGRNFTSPADFNTQLTEWMTTTANTRKVRSLGARPVEKLPEELAAMTRLPPQAPTTGLRNRVRLPRDYYVRLDGNDYSVDPRHIGRLVDVTATPTRVRVVCEGQLIADHSRCWDKHQVIRDDEHIEIAKQLRAQYSARPLRPVIEPRGIDVPTRELSTYDSVFGLQPSPTESAEAVA